MDTNKHGKLIDTVLGDDKFNHAEYQCRGFGRTDDHEEATSDIDQVLESLDNIRRNGYESVLLILRNADGLNIGFVYDCETDKLIHETQY